MPESRGVNMVDGKEQNDRNRTNYFALLSEATADTTINLSVFF